MPKVERADSVSWRFEGIEVGAVSAKLCSIPVSGDASHHVIRHGGNPRAAIDTLLNRFGCAYNTVPVITGPSTKSLLDCAYRPETECVERALANYHTRPDIVLSLGGESFIVYTAANGIIKNVLSSSKCASGTGEFIVQQLKRIGMSLEEGLIACESGQIVPLATRCSVHCKSDATHKLNKGECTPSDIARSLIRDLAKKVSKMVSVLRWPTKEILVTGGLSLNRPFVKDLIELLSGSQIVLFPESPSFEAFGASLLSADAKCPTPRLSSTILVVNRGAFASQKHLADFECKVDYRVEGPAAERVELDRQYILGVDAGSTTTKAVLLDAAKDSVAASCYLRTNGNPVEATRACLSEIRAKAQGAAIDIVQVAVTGSGREVVSVFLDNCLAFNEILAHARASSAEVANADTIFEIGGQDSKYVSMHNGVPIDYAMNDGCSAGTGSFLEESAAVDMNMQFTDISTHALDAKNPIMFGERCAAFINTDLRNALQQGARRDDVVAGLVYSVADNFISRVVGARSIGDTILFQGGVALNRAVSHAMSSITGKRVVVPRRPELMGCIGAALMVKDLMAKGLAESRRCDLELMLRRQVTTAGTFTCASCENRCSIKKLNTGTETHPFGGLCSKYDRRRHKSRGARTTVNLFDLRNEVMFRTFGATHAEHARGTIAIPLALLTYELFPFFAKLINGLGYNVSILDPREEGYSKTLAPICYPCEILHGAVSGFGHSGADFLFLPYVLSLEDNEDFKHSFSCSTTAVIPGIIKSAFEDFAERIVSPHILLSDQHARLLCADLAKLSPQLAVDRSEIATACTTAFAHHAQYQATYSQLAAEAIAKIGDEPAIILAGRPYVICSPHASLSIPRKISSRGYHVIPMDALPRMKRTTRERNCWHFTQQIMNSVNHVKANGSHSLCIVSCFSCGPDAPNFVEVRERLGDMPFCYLEIDSHTAHAGIETRIEAFLEIIERRRAERASGV